MPAYTQKSAHTSRKKKYCKLSRQLPETSVFPCEKTTTQTLILEVSFFLGMNVLHKFSDCPNWKSFLKQEGESTVLKT